MNYKRPNAIDVKGQKNPNVKLTDEDVDQIRQLSYFSKLSLRTLSSLYGVSHTQIRRIIKHKSRA